MTASEHRGFSSFDYTTVHGVPEITLRVDLLGRRLQQLSKGAESQVLEVGVGTGDTTVMLAQHFGKLTCVEPDEENYRQVRSRLATLGLDQVEFIRCKVEDAQLGPAEYDHIVLLGLLEHLGDPVSFLRDLVSSLRPGGCVHVLVNLVNSIHRLLGVEMGLIAHIEELSEADIRLGHYRVYSPSMLRDHLDEAGLQVTYEQPFYLKPLPTSMLTALPMEVHRGLDMLGRRLPEFASYMYLEATI